MTLKLDRLFETLLPYAAPGVVHPPVAPGARRYGAASLRSHILVGSLEVGSFHSEGFCKLPRPCGRGMRA